MSGFCISTEYLSTSVIFIPALSSGAVMRDVITAWGDEPVPTVWRPTRSVRTIGFTPSFLPIIIAKPPSTSSRTGRPFFTWSFPFMPSFAVAPPATMTTFSYTPACTRADASMRAWVGAAQKPLVSEPVAFTAPAASAMDLAKLPPPRWFMSPQASSEHSITYSMHAGSILFLSSRCLKASTPEAFTTRFSNIMWELRFMSMSWAFFTQATSFPPLYMASAPLLFTASSISDASSPSPSFFMSSSVKSPWLVSFSFTAPMKSLSILTSPKASAILSIPMNSSWGIISPILPCLVPSVFLSCQGDSILPSSSGVMFPMYVWFGA